MNYDNICFHNAEELFEVPGKDGLRIQRVSEELRTKLNTTAQTMMMSPVANVEIRFLLLSDSVDITLSAEGETNLKMFVHWGGFQEREPYEITQEPTTIKLEIQDRYKRMDAEHTGKSPYGYRLVRLMFTGMPDVQLFYHGISNGDVRVPSTDDLPSRTLLSYGTSITHGARLSAPHLTYPFLTAHNLGMDVINLGSAGSAHCEKEMADHIADRGDWDIATLALSVNMYHGFSLEAYSERLTYMVNKVAGENVNKPVYCITLYPFFDDVEVYNEDSPRCPEAYRQVLRDIVKACEYDNVRLVEGNELLADFSLLAPDLIHPNDLGMIQIANNLSERIKKYS